MKYFNIGYTILIYLQPIFIAISFTITETIKKNLWKYLCLLYSFNSFFVNYLNTVLNQTEAEWFNTFLRGQ